MATFTVNLSCLKSKVADARDCLVEQSNELTATLTDAGIPPADILTAAVNLNKEYDWTRNGQVFKGYRGSTSLLVTVEDLAVLGDLYTELLEDGQLDLYGLQYGHSRMDSLRNVAYLRALGQANALADQLAGQLPGGETRRIVAISNVDTRASAPPPAWGETSLQPVAAEQSAPQSLAINTGTMRVETELWVDYGVR